MVIVTKQSDNIWHIASVRFVLETVGPFSPCYMYKLFARHSGTGELSFTEEGAACTVNLGLVDFY